MIRNCIPGLSDPVMRSSSCWRCGAKVPWCGISCTEHVFLLPYICRELPSAGPLGIKKSQGSDIDLNLILETNFISAVPLNLTFRSAFFVYQHIRRFLNDCGSRQSILKFRTALESPFHFQCNTAIPPPAALCENMIENVLLFLYGFSCLVMGIIVRKGLFVKKNNKKSLETCKLCQPERKMVISKKNITFQKLP